MNDNNIEGKQTMGMFLNYQSIAENYAPNNLISSFPVGKSYTKLDPVQASKPYEEYNTNGELIGYFWRYGETLNLEFNIDGEITVESDAIIYVNSGDAPDTMTAGKVDQKAYNTADLISWTCTQIVNDIYVWEQDAEFTYNEYSDTRIYVSAKEFLKDKQIKVTLFNFRMESIYSKIYSGNTKIILPITKDLSESLKRGIYYCALTVFNDDTVLPIFTNSDCTLIVK